MIRYLRFYLGTQNIRLYSHMSAPPPCGTNWCQLWSTENWRGGRAPWLTFCRRNNLLLIKMLLMPCIENSHLNGVIGLVEVDDSAKSRSEQQSKGFSVAWFVLWINPTGFDYSGFRYGTNLLMGRGCTCCMLGMKSGVGEEELWITLGSKQKCDHPAFCIFDLA